MKANEVLKKYAAGERDFRRKNLRGQSFQGENLSGADFSEADIRGANFKNANLTGTKFCRAKAGLQKRSTIVRLLVSWIMSGLSGMACLFLWVLIELIFNDSNVTNQFFFGIVFVIIILLLAVILRKGIEGAVVFVVILPLTGLIAVIGFLGFGLSIHGGVVSTRVFREGLYSIITYAGIAIFAGVATYAAAVAGVVSGVVAVAVAGVGAGVVAVAVAVTGALVVAIVSGVNRVVEVAGVGVGVVAVAVSIVFVLIGAYRGWRALKGDPREALIRTIAIAFAATGGTSFYKADLTHADFTGATLKSTDLRKANLTRTCWQNTIKLDRARPGNTILADRAVRKLLVSGNGYNKSYVNANLRGANLIGANLNKANLKLADISEATLEDANLESANLTEAQAVGTDFTHAYLTGACLEAWNIDSTTRLTDVDCQYVFLLENPNAMGSRERRPHDSNRVFEAGDFEKLYQQIMNTVQILLRNGVNPEAFRQAFQELMAENPDISGDSIQGIERKGNDILLTLEVPESTDKGKVEREFLAVYQARLEAAKQTALLEAERSHLKDVKEIVRAAFTTNQLSNPTINLTNTVQAENDMSDNSQSFDIDKIQANNPKVNNMSNLQGNQFNNSNFGGIAGRDYKGDVRNNNYAPDKNLAEAAAEIQQLLNQLSHTNPTSTEIEKLTVVARAAEEIKNNPTLKSKVINALESGGIEAFKEAIDHPLVNILMATIEGWKEA